MNTSTLKVLIVDNDSSFREMIAMSARYYGCDPVTLPSGEDALEYLKGILLVS